MPKDERKARLESLRQAATERTRLRSQVLQSADLPDGSVSVPDVWQFCYLLAAAAMGMIFLSMAYTGVEYDMSLKLIFLAVIILTVKWWTGAVLLALFQVNLFYLENTRFPETLTQRTLWVVIGIFLLMSVSRYRTVQDLDRNHKVILMRLASIRRRLGVLTRDTAARRHVALNVRAVFLQIFRSMFLTATCALVALILIAVTPLRGRMELRSEFILRPTEYRALMLGFLLFALHIPVWLLVNESVWRTRSPQQARMYLRSTFLGWIHRDLRMIIKKRIRIRRAGVRALKRVKPNVEPVESEGIF